MSNVNENNTRIVHATVCVHVYILVVNFLLTYFATGTARFSVAEVVNCSHFTAGRQHRRILTRNPQKKRVEFYMCRPNQNFLAQWTDKENSYRMYKNLEHAVAHKVWLTALLKISQYLFFVGACHSMLLRNCPLYKCTNNSLK